MKAWVSFLDWGVKEGYFEKNYMREHPVPKQPKQLPKYLSKEEAQRLLDWTKNFSYVYRFEKYRAIAVIGTFIFTGIRKAELMNLKMEDVDIQNRILTVKLGKGGKDRVIPLCFTVIEYYENYLKERARLNKYCPYFFTAMRQDTQIGTIGEIDHPLSV
jgi:site-specific recombinase XerD